MSHPSHSDLHDDLDLRLEDVLRYAIAIGAVLVLLLPAARGFSQMFGWLPLWLVAMPLAALWALRESALRWSRGVPRSDNAPVARRRRSGPQARRRTRPDPRRALPRAA